MIIFKDYKGNIIRLQLGHDHKIAAPYGDVIYSFRERFNKDILLIVQFPEGVNLFGLSQSILEQNLGIEKVTGQVGYNNEDFITNRLTAILTLHPFNKKENNENDNVAFVKRFTFDRNVM